MAVAKKTRGSKTNQGQSGPSVKDKLQMVLGQEKTKVSLLSEVELDEDIANALVVFESNKQLLSNVINASLIEFDIVSVAREFEKQQKEKKSTHEREQE